MTSTIEFDEDLKKEWLSLLDQACKIYTTFEIKFESKSNQDWIDNPNSMCSTIVVMSHLARKDYSCNLKTMRKNILTIARKFVTIIDMRFDNNPDSSELIKLFIKIKNYLFLNTSEHIRNYFNTNILSKINYSKYEIIYQIAYFGYLYPVVIDNHNYKYSVLNIHYEDITKEIVSAFESEFFKLLLRKQIVINSELIDAVL